jgi:hypothetical protein
VRDEQFAAAFSQTLAPIAYAVTVCGNGAARSTMAPSRPPAERVQSVRQEARSNRLATKASATLVYRGKKKGTFICDRKITLRQFFTSWLAPEEITVGGKDLPPMSYTLAFSSCPCSASPTDATLNFLTEPSAAKPIEACDPCVINPSSVGSKSTSFRAQPWWRRSESNLLTASFARCRSCNKGVFRARVRSHSEGS